MHAVKLRQYTDEEIAEIDQRNYEVKVQLNQYVYDLSVAEREIRKQARQLVITNAVYIALIAFILIMWRLQ